MKKLIVSLIFLVLALLCFGCRAENPAGEEIETRDVWSETQESIQPATQESIQPETEPETEPATEESVPPETEQTVPPETEERVQSETQPNVQSRPIEYENDYFQTVERLLDNSTLDETAVPVSLCNASGSGSSKRHTLMEEAAGAALVQSCAQRAVNPVAAYRYLVRKGVFTRVTQDEVFLSLTLIDGDFSSPLCGRDVSVSVPSYTYSQYGCQMLMRDVILLAARLGEGSVYEGWLTESDEEMLVPEIHYSEADECYYGYFIYYDELCANVLCVYIRSGDGRNITDLEFQLLDLDYYIAELSAGISLVMDAVRVDEDTRIASLIMASELLLTGKTQLDIPDEEDLEDPYNWGVTLPMSHSLGEWSVNVSRIYYTSTVDVEGWFEEELMVSDSIINYRIRK